MSTIEEIREVPEKFRVHLKNLIALMKKHKITGVGALIDSYRNNFQFKEEWRALWLDIAKADGGKLSLTTIGLLFGAAMGGVGIAAGGTAIGIPLFVVLGLGGFLSGSLVDSFKAFSSHKRVSITIPGELYDVIKREAAVSGVSPKTLIEQALNVAYGKGT